MTHHCKDKAKKSQEARARNGAQRGAAATAGPSDARHVVATPRSFRSTSHSGCDAPGANTAPRAPASAAQVPTLLPDLAASWRLSRPLSGSVTRYNSSQNSGKTVYFIYQCIVKNTTQNNPWERRQQEAAGRGVLTQPRTWAHQPGSSCARGSWVLCRFPSCSHD